MHRHRTFVGRNVARPGSNSKVRLGFQLDRAIGIEGAFAERHGRDMAFSDCPCRQDEVDRAVGCSGLVRMDDDRRIHDRGGLVAVFMAEIGTNQGAVIFVEGFEAAVQLLDLAETVEKNAARLPVAAGEVAIDLIEDGSYLIRIERGNGVADAADARKGAHDAVTGADTDLKRQDDDALRVGP